MTLHREGTASILITLLICGLAVGGAWYGLKGTAFSWVIYVVGGLCAALLAIVLNFFRHPHFEIPKVEGGVLSPCNGKVVVIEEVDEQVYFKKKMLQISVFMSPLDVHVNRNLVQGVVRFARYFPGKYLVAWDPKSSTENEQTFIVVEDATTGHEVGVKQIAGALARRICFYVKEGDRVEQGGEFGFIKFGSRCDLLLPLGTKVETRLGAVVKGGRTLMARLPDNT